jgi:hypothetical protein
MIGHDRVRAALERELPPVALITGVAGVGKWALAGHLLQFHASGWDVLRLRDKWGVREARGAGVFAQQVPERLLRVIAADLSMASTAHAQTALLKTLEEPPPYARFLLVAEPGVALPTVVSRAQSYYLGPLSQADTVSVLEGLGLSGAEAAAAAVLAPGRPGAAYSVAADALAARDRVREVLSAARDGSSRRLDRLFRAWSPLDSTMFGCWAQEAATGAWRVFTAAEAPRGGKQAARSILRERAQSNARPQIADRRIIDAAVQQHLI